MEESLQFWKWMAWLIPIISAFVGGLLTIYAVNKKENIAKYIENENKKKQALSGVIKPKPNDSGDDKQMIRILFGNSGVGQSKEHLRNGFPFQPIVVDGDNRIIVKLGSDDEILISSSFRSLDNTIVATLTNNEWEINPNSFFRRNFDSKGLEVIDKEGILKFQVDYENDSTIRIGGCFVFGHALFVITRSEMRFINLQKTTREQIIKHSESIPNMFVYPAETHLGERLKKD